MSFFGEEESSQSPEDDVRQTFGGREATLLLVECNEEMLQQFATPDGQQHSLFSVVMRAAYEQLRAELEANSGDLFGIVLFGTERNSDEATSFKHVYTFLPLEQANLDRLIELSRLSTDFDRAAFNERFGGLAVQHVELADVFWTAQNAFANCRLNLNAKRTILATNNPEPMRHSASQAASFRRALTKATDLLESGIELVPLTLVQPSSEQVTFDLSKFFEKLNLDESILHTARRPCWRVAEVLSLLQRKTTLRRAYCRLDVELFNGGAAAVSFATGCFAPIRPARIPPRVRVDRQTNELVQARARLYVPAAERERVLALGNASADAARGRNAAEIPKESDILLPQVDVRRAVTYADRKVVFDREEINALHNFGQPRLRLLSFVPLNSVKLLHYVRAPLFLYPDDERIRGSTQLFTALLSSCLQQQVAAMGVLVPRRGVAPRLVALVPQRERFGADDAAVGAARTQLCASGFVVLFRPFVDDLRKFELSFVTESGQSNVQERASLTQVAEARRLVDALIDDRFSVRSVRNPAVATHYANLEAVALDLAERRPLSDQSLPSKDEFERVALLLEQFESCLFAEPTANAVSNTKKKRPAASAKRDADDNASADGNATSSRKIQKLASSEEKAIDWQTEAQKGTLSKFTIPQLKECIKSFGIRPEGSKKQDLVDAIEKHFTRV